MASSKRKGDLDVPKKPKRSSKTPATPMDLDEVPNELFLIIFAKLSKMSHLRLKRVCSRWQSLLLDPTLAVQTLIDVRELHASFKAVSKRETVLVKLALSGLTANRIVFVADDPKKKPSPAQEARQFPYWYTGGIPEGGFKHIRTVVLDGIEITHEDLQTFIAKSNFPDGTTFVMKNIVCGWCPCDHSKCKYCVRKCIGERDRPNAFSSVLSILMRKSLKQDLADDCLQKHIEDHDRFEWEEYGSKVFHYHRPQRQAPRGFNAKR